MASLTGSAKRPKSTRDTPEAREQQEEEFQLRVVRTIYVDVHRADTVRKMKALLSGKEDVLSGGPLELYFCGNRLHNEQKLSECGIDKDSTLHLHYRGKDFLILSVRIPSIGNLRKTVEIEAQSLDTVARVKQMISAKGVAPSEQYSLFHSGKKLDEDKTLAYCSIRDGSTLHAVIDPRNVLPVSVGMPGGEIVQVELKALYAIRDVKAILESMSGSSFNDHELCYEGNQLDDLKTLASYCIREGSLLELRPLKMQIFVKTGNWATVTLDVTQLDLIEKVKAKLSDKINIPVGLMSLWFEGRKLAGDRDLVSYGVQKHSTLHLSLWKGNRA